MSGVTTATAVAIGATAVAAAGTAYSAYVANDNAIDAKNAAEKQKQIDAQRASAAAEQQKQEIERQTAITKSKQRNALAGAGLKLDDLGTADAILNETQRLGDQDIATTEANLRMRLEDGQMAYDKTISGLPSTGSIIAGGALNFGSKAASIYSGYQQQQAYSNSLDKAYGTADTNNMFTGTSNNRYTLLGGNYK